MNKQDGPSQQAKATKIKKITESVFVHDDLLKRRKRVAAVVIANEQVRHLKCLMTLHGGKLRLCPAKLHKKATLPLS